MDNLGTAHIGNAESQLLVTTEGILQVGSQTAPTMLAVVTTPDFDVLADPSIPGRLMAFDIPDLDDPNAARQWLPTLIGQEATDRIQEFYSNPPSDATTISVTFARGPAWDSVWRLALLCWLEQWSYIPFDASILSLEIALTAATVDLPALTNTISERLDEGKETLELLSELKRAGELPPRCGEELRRLVGGAEGVLHPDVIDLLGAPLLPVTNMWAGPVPVNRGVVGARESVATKADSQAANGVRKDSVDWAQVPSRLLDAAEGTVHSRYDAIARTLLVEVVAAPQSEPDSWLRVRLLDPSDKVTPYVADAPLRYDPSRGLYRAELFIASYRSTFAIDVYSAASTIPPRIEAGQQRILTAQRHAARGIAETRAALASPPEKAADLFKSAGVRWEDARGSLTGLGAEAYGADVASLRAQYIHHELACRRRCGHSISRVQFLEQLTHGLPRQALLDLTEDLARATLTELSRWGV